MHSPTINFALKLQYVHGETVHNIEHKNRNILICAIYVNEKFNVSVKLSLIWP